MTKQQVIDYLQPRMAEYLEACEDQNGEAASFDEWCAEIGEQVENANGDEDDVIAIADASIMNLQANWL